MKFIVSQLAYLLTEQQSKRDLLAFFRYLSVLAGLVLLYSVTFHVLMLHVEDQQHSWLTGLYWTLTVMTTLGFGDITFHSDVGRLFSIFVLMSGVVTLLIMLPFTFIRFFYAPWLEAQVRLRAPRKLAEGVTNHIVLCHWDPIAQGLVERLKLLDIPYCVIEPEPGKAAQLHGEGIHVVRGEVDALETYAAVAVEHAQLVLANLDDATNTNIALTVRERSGSVRVAAIIEDHDALDILELSGASHVIPLKHMLGEQLASRVTVGAAHANVIGRFRSLHIVEFPVHNTPLVGQTLREARLREQTGLTVVACWDRGRLLPARPDTQLGEYSVLVAVGTEEQVNSLNAMFVFCNRNDNPVVVIGGGKVGRAVARALKRRDVKVHLVEKQAELAPWLTDVADDTVIGDAADRAVLMRAGLDKAPSVVITTNNDANNIYLTVYCRRLNPDLRIVSRITHERNLEAVNRAGADFVLSYGWLGVKLLLAVIQDREMVVLGEGIDLFMIPVPKSLGGKTLLQSSIGAKVGLHVIALQKGEVLVPNPPATHKLEPGSELLAIGTAEQRTEFRRLFSA